MDGVVSFEKDPKGSDFVVVTADDGERFERQIVYGSTLRVSSGDTIKKGDLITEGAVEPNEILTVCGHLAVQDYLIKEVQRTYRTQGVDINDKHIEVIVRQMMRKVRIVDGGDTSLIIGATVDKTEMASINNEIQKLNEEDGGCRRPAEGMPVLLGITKASLATDSFMSAASFQETTRVLTEAAIKGKVDHLLGLKENVIIGKLVPAGTGTVDYDTLELVNTVNASEPAEEKTETAEPAPESNVIAFPQASMAAVSPAPVPENTPV